MKKYAVHYEQRALKMLKKLDPFERRIIVDWIENNLVNTINPRAYGKSLTGEHSNKWNYRVGNYRLLAEIVDEKIVINILKVGHRKDIY